MRAKVNSIELGGVTNLFVMAPIKAGFVPGFETITYLDRLRRLLKALHAARQNLRESELNKPVFPDSIGRFGIIHSFRYAIVPPRRQPGHTGEPGESLLSLNVTFDGGWEPYMRVIHRDIGTLLDALFCHCVGYPGSTSNFDAYCRWVRSNEVDGGIFYVDSAMSLGDQHYLERVERVQRDSSAPADADKAIAGLALPSDHEQIMQSFADALAHPTLALPVPIRTLKGLYRLAPFFPDNNEHDDRVLIRFAQAVLKEFGQVIQNPAVKDSALWKPFAAALADELAWFQTPNPAPAIGKRPAYTPTALQRAVLGGPEPVSHGCVVLLAVRSADDAARHLASLAPVCALPPGADAIQHHVTFTYAGLLALGIPAGRLDLLPQEFMEGMEARCGTLGDLRGNHPDRWPRPLRHDDPAAPPSGERIDLTTVHVVIVMRLIDPANKSPALHPKLKAAVDALRAPGTGLHVLSLQPTRSYRDPASGMTREHFGFVDGISQPKIVDTDSPAPRSDEVRPGELLLGHANDRGDAPFPAPPDPLLHNGSFLVLRKLRQHVDTLSAMLEQKPKNEVLAKMMGRDTEGHALAGPAGEPTNSFTYDADPKGAACPFHSHIRRANPRDARRYMPRLLRRGMSYGARVGEEGSDATSERGIVFMAYCASIAEQFETIQRWIAGGNSSGVSSAQADPFLGVPQAGESRTFRYVDANGQTVRVDLGDKPLVSLEWGLYLFAPSLDALAALNSFRQAPKDKPSVATAAPTPAGALDAWRERLEDPDRSPATWAAVRAEPDGKKAAAPYGTLVGRHTDVLKVLKDDGAKYSVQGYGRRMAQSIGLNFLGIDPADGHTEQAEHAPSVNAVIEDIDAEKAFNATAPIVAKALARFAVFKQEGPDGSVRIPIDLIALSEGVLARLCAAWFGLPDPNGRYMVPGGRVTASVTPPRCPGNLFTASHYVFTPHAGKVVEDAGRAQGGTVLQAVEALLASGEPLGELGTKIRDRLQHIDAKDRAAVIARSISGMLLGFPPTVHGNFLRTLETWIDGKALWTCQQLLAEVPATVTDPFERAERALLKPLFDTMRGRPLPEMLWRCPVVHGAVVHDESQHVVLGIASALTDPEAPDVLMFGGSRDPKSPLKTVHACPGYGMAIGVMLALISGLLGAGTLRPTGSPVLLMLSPHPTR